MNLPHPASPDAPKYWKFESSGQLIPVVTRYINGKRLGPNEVRLMRAYLCQWINSPVWDQCPGEDQEGRDKLQALRTQAAAIDSQRDVAEWLRTALDEGIDPL